MPANIPPTTAALALIRTLKEEPHRVADAAFHPAHALAQAEAALTLVSLLTYYEMADPTKAQARILGIEAHLSPETEAMLEEERARVHPLAREAKP